MSKAAQGFSPEAYLKYVEGGNPRRTPLIDKIAIYGWKLTYTGRFPQQLPGPAQSAWSGDTPQQAVSPGPGTRFLFGPDREE